MKFNEQIINKFFDRSTKQSLMTKSLQFLSGGGEMGALMRNYNWKSSPIGPVDKWSQILRTTLSILLNSKFPMFLYWGPDLICFYNDAYRFSLGNDGKHPLLLGMKGEEAWKETWHIIKPPIDQVLTSGEATWSEDQFIPIYREGEMKDAYWTFSFSPIKNEKNQTAGVFLTLIETTDKVNNLKKLEETNDQLHFAIEATELGTFDFNPLTNKFIGNNRLKDWFSLPHEMEVDLPMATAMILKKDRNRVIEAIQKALEYESDGFYDIEYSIINPLTKQERIVRAKGRVWFGDDKTAYRFNGTLQDITQQAISKIQIEASEKRFSNILSQSLMAIAIFKGPSMIVTFANKPMLNVLGKGNAVLNKPLLEGVPELKEQAFPQLLANVYSTGVAFEGFETKAILVRNGIPVDAYFNFVYQPYRDVDDAITGITVLATEVTEQVNAKKQIEQNEAEQKKLATHLKLATDSANVAIWSLDVQKQVLEWSSLHKKLWGYDPNREDLTYEDWHKVILPEDKELAFQKIEEAKFNENVYEVEYRINRANDHVIRSMRSVGKYYYNEQGEIETLTGISVDITDQKAAAEKIRQSEERFRTLAEAIPQLIWITNEKGEYEYTSSQWIEYSGLDPHFENSWQQLIHPDDMKGMMENWGKSLATGKPYKAEARLKNKQGEYLWHIVNGVAIKNEEHKIVKWIGAFTDIHEQKEKEHQKDEFISIASHEMKTPLTTAKGYLKLLLRKLSEENETAFLYANKSNQAVERLHTLVTELLDASKIQNGKLDYNISLFDFNEMVDEAIENIQLTTNNHSLQKIGNSLHQIKGDKNRLQQVMINLLSNAVKYSPKADKIFIKVEELDGNIQVSVQDFGVGMLSQHLNKVFDRYYRVQEHVVHFPGLGIGLYISSNIIQRHEGKMWVESEPNKGSIFHFSLPI